MLFYSSIILAAAGLAAAWLPGEGKAIVALDGTTLFTSAVSVTGRAASKRWLPASSKIRGVNLGSHFVFEPWIAEAEWSSMGCGGKASEYDCVLALGQAKANSVFQKHWDTWITQKDITKIKSSGLNTIRVPVGYWMREDLVYANSEHFPQGAFTYLQRLCGWASDAGLYIILDLHGAPGAQIALNAFTGQNAPTPGFYADYQFERALKFLEWMTQKVHTINEFRNVGMLEVVNEPVQNSAQVGTLRSTYYPNAFQRIRAAEAALGVNGTKALHIQMMNAKWGSGDPTQYLAKNKLAAFDDHRYLKWAGIETSQANYISTSCNDNRGGNSPTIVGEWSLSVPDDVQWTAGWDPSTQQAFYKKWFAAQVIAYEKQAGWVFWTWKSQLGDYRWAYQDAVAAGVIPTNLDSVYTLGVC